MTKKDLFIIIIKLIGLILLISSLFVTLPSTLYLMVVEPEIMVVLLSVANFLLLGGMFLYIIFYADKIVNLLKLDADLSHKEIDLTHLKSYDIMRVAVIALGIYMIINNITDFLYYVIVAFKSSVANQNMVYAESDSPFTFNEYVYWAVYGVNILIGYLLITNVKRISRFLNRTD